ncbi:MAG: M20/M25/M40 family metallo-hydrolase [Bacteroidales bacterium]|nr:M20/M25/M40 family metallo-hydrolase [Bacteroidales bacterium]
MGPKIKTQNKQKDGSCITLLKSLIAIPSYSGREKAAADLLECHLLEQGLQPVRHNNNIWLLPVNYSQQKENVLLNGHIDTVQPSGEWSYNPHQPVESGGKIFGLGSNDAGAALVCLLDTFMHFQKQQMPFNLIFSATAEEETGGDLGIQSILDELPGISLGIMGEPTSMHMATAERGLLVIDGIATGTVTHAALENPDNAILKAIKYLHTIQDLHFDKRSAILGDVRITLSQVHGGNQHNVTPSQCRFILDIRLNERYSPQEVMDTLQQKGDCTLRARSLNKKASAIPRDHPIVQSAKNLDVPTYGSQTLSNMACVPFPCIKIGPGQSSRSHQPDEYICRKEIETGRQQYIHLINQYISLL